MKGNKVIIAALLVAALMVMPIALFTSNEDTAADPGSPFDTSFLSGLAGLDPKDLEILSAIGKLSGGLTYEPHAKTAYPIDEDKTIASDKLLIMDKDFTYNGKYTITVESGGAAVMCVGQDFSITSANQVGGIIFEDGASFYILNTLDGVTTVSSITNSMIVDKTTFDSDTPYYMKGSVDYKMKLGMDGIDAALTVTEGTIVTNTSDLEKANNKVEFPSENTISAKILMTASSDGKTMEIKDGLVKTNIDIKETSKVDENTMTLTLKGSGEYKINASIPKEVGTMTASAKGSINLTFSYNDTYDATFKNNVDVSVKIENYNSTTADPVSTISGSVSFSVNYGKLKVEQTDVTAEISNLKSSVDIKFNNDGFKISASAGLGSYYVTPKDGMESYIKDVSADLTYEAAVDITKIQPPALTSLLVPSLGAGPNPEDTMADMMKEYLNGIEEGTKDKSVKEYASSFFLGKLDAVINQGGSVMKTKSVSASFSVGDVCIYGDWNLQLSGLKVSAEISDSVGVSASFKMSKLVYSTSTMKVMIQPLNVSLDTYTGEDKDKYVFVADFKLSGEMKAYLGGTLVYDPFINNLNGTVDIGAETVALKNKITSNIEKVAADEITTNAYGIDISAKNVKYVPGENGAAGQFEASKMTVSGYYYGGSYYQEYGMIKSIDGTYNNVKFQLGMDAFIPEFNTMTVESVKVKYTDIYDNSLTIERSYDKTENAIVNNYKADGAFWLYNVLRDDALYSLVDNDDLTFEGAPTETAVGDNYVFEGKIIVDMDPIGLIPGDFSSVKLAGKNITISYNWFDNSRKLNGGFSGEVYVACEHLIGSGLTPIAFDVNGNRSILNTFDGAAMGISVDKDGAVYYKVIALPGNNLEVDSGIAGFTMGEIKDNEAPATGLSTTDALVYHATPIEYKIYVDGKVMVENVLYKRGAKIDNVGEGVLVLVDQNGKEWGNVNSDNSWTLGAYTYVGDLELTTVTVKEITDVVKGADKLNETTETGIFFANSLTSGEVVKFKLGSNVRFDIGYAVGLGDKINLVAQETKFDGKKAFIIKAESNGVDVKSTLYFPASEGEKIMHVDQYGRVTELSSSLVKIGDETFLKVNDVSSYSIFYVDNDKPRYDVPGGSDNMLLIVAIAAVVAVLAAAGLFFLYKKKQPAYKP